MDYGHPLEAGSFGTPANDPPAVAVAVAWTLLTWVAAQTRTITIDGNVLNVPMRPGARAGPRRGQPRPAQRRDDIDYYGLPGSLAAVEPGDHANAKVRSTYMRGGTPGLVIQPRTVDEVVDAP